MTKQATPQELKVLRFIPSASSGNTLSVPELAELVGASERAVRIILAILHRKELIATDDFEFSDRSGVGFRTETGNRAVAKIYAW